MAGGLGSAMGKTSTAGGVSDEQKALAEYTFGQNELATQQTYAGGPGGQGGPGISTMETAAVGGNRFNQAYNLAQMSDADYRAAVQFNNQQAQSLEQIAGQAGQALGGLGGGGGGGGGGTPS